MIHALSTGTPRHTGGHSPDRDRFSPTTQADGCATRPAPVGHGPRVAVGQLFNWHLARGSPIASQHRGDLMGRRVHVGWRAEIECQGLADRRPEFAAKVVGGAQWRSPRDVGRQRGREHQTVNSSIWSGNSSIIPFVRARARASACAWFGIGPRSTTSGRLCAHSSKAGPSLRPHTAATADTAGCGSLGSVRVRAAASSTVVPAE